MTPDSWSTGVAANVPGAQHVPVLVRLQPFVGRHQKGQQCPIAKFNKIQLPRPGHHPDHSFRETLSMGGRLVDPAMLVDSGLFKLSIQTWFCTVPLLACAQVLNLVARLHQSLPGTGKGVAALAELCTF